MNNEIINNDKNNDNCKPYKWVKHIIKKQDNGTTYQYVTVGKQDNKTGLYLVSPISDFILHNYSNKTTTMLAQANVIVAFLNFADQKQQSNKIDFLFNLTVQDGLEFLDSLIVNPKTKKTYANTLEKFYLFMEERDVISIKEKPPYFKGRYKNTMQNNNKEAIHNIDPVYLPLFINTAIQETPEIAFGIYLQCFGGLRCSEVVSLEYKDIAFQCNSYDGTQTITVSLHDKDLRPDLQYAFAAKCKRNRKQQIISVYGNLLQTLYIKHRDTYKQTDTNAVFIDGNNNPMTAGTYSAKFKRFKNAFIQRLSESDDFNARSYALYLQSHKWSTHICRGIFSNLIASTTNNILEIAAWRGDTQLASALTYLQTKETIENDVKNVLDKFISNNFLSKVKED